MAGYFDSAISAYNWAQGQQQNFNSWYNANILDPARTEMNYNAEQAQIARDFSALEAEKNREFNASEAQKNRDYQTEMANSAYQRAVSDLRAAGLNPYLAYGNGGAATPSGAVASGSAASASSASYSSKSSFIQNMTAVLGSTVNTARDLIKLI